MERFISPFLRGNSLYSSYKQPPNIDFNSDESVIKYLKKNIFLNEVYVQYNNTLNAIFSNEKYCLSDDIFKKVIVQLVDVLNSNLEDEVKLFIFRCVFQAVVSENNQEEVSVTLKFFVLLSHILGIPSLLDSSEFQDVPLVINKTNFENAFGVQASSSSVYWVIFKELSMTISKLHINFASPENQPYFKWLEALVKVLAKAEPQENIHIEILTVLMDVEFSILENNLELIFTNIFQNNKSMNEDFIRVYSEFFQNSLKTAFKFQRFVKFVNRFLTAVQNSQSEILQKNIIPPNVSQEFSKHSAMLSSQQSLLLMETLIQYWDQSSKEVSQHQKCVVLFEVTSSLLVLYFKELKVYSPNIPFSIFQSFINQFTNLKSFLQEFKNFLISEISFLSKNKEILQFYLEVCLYFNEIQILVYCYKDTFSQFSSTLNNGYQNCFASTEWDALVETFLKKKWKNCQPLFFQMALQRLRSIKLENQNAPPNNSLLKIILSTFSSTLENFNIFNYLTPEDMILIMEFFSLEQSKIIITKFIDFIMQNNDENHYEFFLTDSRLLENSNFIIILFDILIKKVNLIFKGDFSEKVVEFFDEYFDDDNEIYINKVEKMSEKINYLLNDSHKIRKKFVKITDHGALLKILNIFSSLPLFYMDQPLKRLGLSFAVALTVIVSNKEALAVILLQNINNYLNSDVDASTCFHIGLCIKWLGELSFDKRDNSNLKIKIMEKLIRIAPNTRLGLSQISEFIGTHSTADKSLSPEILETQVTLYQELGKCWFRAKKRKSENDIIGNFRTKIAKIISENSSELKSNAITDENYKFLYKIFAIELHKAIKEENQEFLKSMQEKLSGYFDFAINKLSISYDDNCSSFLSALLQYMTQIRTFIAEDSLPRIWSVFKKYERENWKLFAISSTDAEFEHILSDLVQISQGFLCSTASLSPNYFEIWIAFLNVEVEAKSHISQVQLQKLFRNIHDYDFFVNNLSVEKKTHLIKFFGHCLANKKIILTTQILDTIFDVTLHCSDDNSLTNEDFHVLFNGRVEVAMSILSKQYTWSKNKVHLTFTLFQRMVNELTKRSDVTLELNQEELSVLSDCGLSAEKWVNAIVKREKDFARIIAYFITTIISGITAVTVVPAVKIHLNNCLNHLLSISDSHTVTYLLRVLKPGNQQLFKNIYDQFKKFHKYTGKV